MPVYRRSRGHGRTDEVRATASALAALKIAVAGRSATLARLQSVGVHGQSHAAPRLPPFKARRLENGIQSFAFGLRLDLP